MGLFAVIGPSRKDHFGLPRFLALSFSNAPRRSQSARMRRSRAGKSVCGSTLSNAICARPRGANGQFMKGGLRRGKGSGLGGQEDGEAGDFAEVGVIGDEVGWWMEECRSSMNRVGGA